MFPPWPSYTKFQLNESPSIGSLVQSVREYFYSYDSGEAPGITLTLAERRFHLSAALDYKQEQEKVATALAEHFLKQWPCSKANMTKFPYPSEIDIAEALEKISPEWLRFYQNWELSQYLSRVQAALDQHHSDDEFDQLSTEVWEQEIFGTRIRGGEVPCLQSDLLRRGCPSIHTSRPDPSDLFPSATSSRDVPVNGTAGAATKKGKKQITPEMKELRKIVKVASDTSSMVQKHYTDDLSQSLDALENAGLPTEARILLCKNERIASTILIARAETNQRLNHIRSSFELGQVPRVLWLKEGGLWPSTWPINMLENLRSISSTKFGPGMKENLVGFGVSLTNLQHLLRIEYADNRGDRQRLTEERDHVGHTNWRPFEKTDWLLLEIDSNILIRSSQVDVAEATISPPSNSNSVLQMNMGQGK